MKNNKLICIFLCFWLVLPYSCHAKLTAQKVLEKRFSDYKLLHYRQGNFTGSKMDEYVAFYRDKKYPDCKDCAKTIDKVVILILEKNKIKQEYPLGYMVNDDKFWEIRGDVLDIRNKLDVKFLQDINIDFGNWDEYCYISDFNHNSLDEILFFQIDGKLPYIFEYKNRTMSVVLTPPRNDRISKIETLEENGKKIIKIYGPGIIVKDDGTKYGPNNLKPAYVVKPGVVDYYKYTWNAEKGIYENFESGEEELKK
jgi:hypothetical protein